VSAHPSAAICWYHESTPLVPKQNQLIILYDGECTTVKFAQLTPNDVGRYTCKASNVAGEAKTITILEATTTSIGENAPIFEKRMKALSNVSARDGEMATLSATLIQGSTPYDVKWLHMNVEVANSSGFRYVNEGLKCSLVIADTFPEDGGEYACVVSNAYGHDVCKINLSVSVDSRLLTAAAAATDCMSRPQITSAPSPVAAARGATATLRCAYRTPPASRVRWFHNSVALSSELDDGVCIVTDDSSSLLTLSAVSNDQFGHYIVSIVNSLGFEAIASITLLEVRFCFVFVAYHFFALIPIYMVRSRLINERTCVS
jgi:hypothetical protein